MNLMGWLEILFIGILAFVIIGPKDLPKVLFTLGRFMQTLRRLSAEFMIEFEGMHDANEEQNIKGKKLKNDFTEQINQGGKKP